MRAGVRLRSREGDLRSRSAISLQKHSALIINTFTSFGTRVLARAQEQWLLVAIGILRGGNGPLRCPRLCSITIQYIHSQGLARRRL